MKYLFNFDIDEISAEDLRENISHEKIPDKDKIVAFLRSSSPVTLCLFCLIENILNEIIICSQIVFFKMVNFRFAPSKAITLPKIIHVFCFCPIKFIYYWCR